MSEPDILKDLLTSGARNLILGELGVSNECPIFFEVKNPAVQFGEKPGNVDAMICVKGRAEKAIGIQCKTGLFFEESDKTLLCSDLFFHPGDPEPFTGSDVVGRARAAITEGLAGPLANDMPYTPYTDATLRRLADLEPRKLAVMHGSSVRGDGRTAIADLAGVIQEKLSIVD